MSQTSPILLISPPRSRALVAHTGAPGAHEERQRRRFWFSIDQAINSLVMLAVIALFAGYSMLAGRVAIPDTAPAPDTLVSPPGSKFVTAAATRGDLLVRVSASGTVEPVRLVEVSTEMSGTIKAVHVENNDIVKAGQLIAELESETQKMELLRAEAQVAAAAARVKEAEAATVAASKEFARKKTLAARDLAPARDLDNATASSQQTRATVEALTAELKAAQANLAIARTNLEKARIVSPIDGVVLRRNVEPGQTVAASLQSPILFRLAQDLDRMLIRVDVDEADALKVRQGQPATFNVQAMRDRPLEARVEKLHVGAEVVQGVVTYKAILSFDNSALGLRPGMTAMAELVVEDVRGGLIVPNAALRFSPPEAADKESMLTAGTRLMGVGVAPASANTEPSAPLRPQLGAANARLQRLWVDEGGKARPVDVEVGATDGSMTEVVKGPLKAGQRVIVDLVSEVQVRR